MAKMTLLICVLSLLFLDCTAEAQDFDSLNINIVHYQPEQVHLAFGGM